MVRTQSGQIVPPRLKKSSNELRVPPTPPKRKKHLQIEKINQLFMNFVNLNGQEGMQQQQGKCQQSITFLQVGPVWVVKLELI